MQRRTKTGLNSAPAETWDRLSGTSDDQPYDSSLLARVEGLIARYAPRGATHLVDLGGGTGNPSIGLANRGYDVTVVESDPSMADRCRHRARRSDSPLILVRRDWREWIKGRTLGLKQVDIALALGNTLAYQDSWAARLPTRPRHNSLLQTLKSLRRHMAKDGVLIAEVALELPSRRATTVFVRRPPSWGGLASTWIVTCDHHREVRSIDTYVHNGLTPNERVAGYARFVGHLVYEQQLRELLRAAGWSVVLLGTRSNLLRLPFTTVVAKSPGGAA